MRFVFFVEGDTEKALSVFLRRWVSQELGQQVGIQCVKLNGWAEVVKVSRERAKTYLNAPGSDVIAVIALLDLYGLGLPFPRDKKTPTERCAWAKQHLESKVKHPKFRQFFAVHELEAWLLSDPSIFPRGVQDGLAGKVQQPEAVNSQEPPAKLLENLYLTKTRHAYRKAKDGTELFRSLDRRLAYAKCPHLKAMLDEMLRLARGAGL